LEAAPTLLCGFLIAGLIRGMIGSVPIRRLFTDDPLVGPARSWIIGILLPVCSLGVLPVAWELRRAGVPRATVLTFLLAAPLADPFSLTYAFQQLEAHGAFGLGGLTFFLISSFVVTVGTGVLLGRLLPEATTEHDIPRLPASGLRRIGIVILTSARGLTSVLFPILVLTVAGSGVLAIVPGGALERAVDDRSMLAPLKMAWVAFPLYVPTGHGTATLCDLLLSGTSVGVVYVFFQLGVGLNLGTVAWILRSLGWRMLVGTIVLVPGMVLALGYALPFSHPNPVASSVHDRQFFEIESSGGAKAAQLRAIKTTVTNEMGEPQWLLIAACIALGGLALIGVASHAIGKRGSVSYWMANAAEPTPIASSSLNMPLTAPQLTLAGMALVLATVVAGLYVYYPPPGDLLDQIDDLQVELALAIRSDPVPRQRVTGMAIQLQRLQHKLGIAGLLRRGRIEADLRRATDDLRGAIEGLLQGLSEGGSLEELTPLSAGVRQATNRCRDALNRRPGG
jgi:hypothetical protein